MFRAQDMLCINAKRFELSEDVIAAPVLAKLVDHGGANATMGGGHHRGRDGSSSLKHTIFGVLDGIRRWKCVHADKKIQSADAQSDNVIAHVDDESLNPPNTQANLEDEIVIPELSS